MSFDSLGLTSGLATAARSQGFSQPTPIQAQAVPAILQGGDIIAQAQTGSGKTVAFVLPMLQRLALPADSPRATQALVLVPTRELAMQAGETVRHFANALEHRVKTAIVFGGVSVNPQLMALRGGADIVVATPGRLLDLVRHNAVSLSAVSMLVLDEADRLLDLGFADELNEILSLLPGRRQNLLFSATFPPDVQSLADHVAHDATHVDIESTPTERPAIHQRAIEVDAPRRTQLLRHLAEANPGQRMLVFAATKYATDLIADKLGRAGIHAAALHGEHSQGRRRQVLSDFKAGRLQVLVATDLAARGIDIEQLEMVVNYDLARSPTDHVHRIGRTGRAGERGVALSFISAETESHFRLIEKRQNQRIARERIAGFEPTLVAAPVAPPTGGIKGQRKSKKDKAREAAAKLE